MNGRKWERVIKLNRKINMVDSINFDEGGEDWSAAQAQPAPAMGMYAQDGGEEDAFASAGIESAPTVTIQTASGAT